MTGILVAFTLFVTIGVPMTIVVWLWERRAEREDRRLLAAHRSWISERRR